MNLLEEVMNILPSYLFREYEKYYYANKILSLVRDFNAQELTEFVAVKACDGNYHYGTTMASYCPICGSKGLGRIERRMTVKEVMDVINQLLDNKTTWDIDRHTDRPYIQLSSGERVEIRKGDAK